MRRHHTSREHTANHENTPHIMRIHSTFNTIVPIKLAVKLSDLGLNSSPCDWIQDFLTARPQVVKMGQFTSNSITLNIGAPQGCVLSPLLYSLYTHDCVSSHSSASLVKFADDTVVLGLITNNDETAYLDEVERLTSWCQDNCLSLNVSKTEELIADFRKRQQQPYTPLMISGTPVERVSSFKYLGVNINEDLTWTTHIHTQVKKARQRLPSATAEEIQGLTSYPENFLFRAIESVLTQCISVWYSNATYQDCKALQRVVRLAERISGSVLPSLKDIYLKRCKSRAAKIIKDSNHPSTVSSFYCHLASASGAWWQKLRDWGGASSLRPSGSLTQTQFHNIYMTQFTNSNTFTILIIRIAATCIYLVQPVSTSLFILLFIKSSVYCFAHFILLHIFTLYCLFLFFTYIYIYSLVLLLFLHCPLSGPDLIYISLLIMLCIIENMTNKWNLEPWTSREYITRIRLKSREYASNHENTPPEYTMHHQNTPYITRIRLKSREYASNHQNTPPEYTMHHQNTPYITRIRLKSREYASNHENTPQITRIRLKSRECTTHHQNTPPEYTMHHQNTPYITRIRLKSLEYASNHENTSREYIDEYTRVWWRLISKSAALSEVTGPWGTADEWELIGILGGGGGTTIWARTEPVVRWLACVSNSHCLKGKSWVVCSWFLISRSNCFNWIANFRSSEFTLLNERNIGSKPEALTSSLASALTPTPTFGLSCKIPCCVSAIMSCTSCSFHHRNTIEVSDQI